MSPRHAQAETPRELSIFCLSQSITNAGDIMECEICVLVVGYNTVGDENQW